MEVGIHSIKVEAIDEFGKQSDAAVNFVLNPELPVVETLQPSSITSESAVVGGIIVDDRGAPITEAGILWSNEPHDGTGVNELSADVINNSFSITLNDLEYDTYYVIAYAENESGRSYGEQVSFSTLLPVNMITDSRDGNVYKWVKIGTQIWMTENLAYLPELQSPFNYSAFDPFYYVYGYDGFKTNEAKATYNYNAYGVLYNYTAAYDACPDGWSLPTSEEERQLISFIGGDNQIEKLMEEGTDHWNSNANGTNSTGFTARGAGWAELDNDGTFNFTNIGDAAGWWKVDSCAIDTIHGMPFTIELNGAPILNDSECDPFSAGYSVRCIKD